MLPPVIGPPLLMGCQPSEAAEVDVGVMARDIDVGVMDDDVLPPPQVGAAPDQLQRHRHQLVDPGPIRIGLMAAVVLDVEADPRRREPEKNSQEHALPPGLDHEDQEPIQHGEAGKEHGGLHVHLPAVTLPTAGGEKERVDASPQLELEGAVIRKFHALGVFHTTMSRIRLRGREVRLDVQRLWHRGLPQARYRMAAVTLTTFGRQR